MTICSGNCDASMDVDCGECTCDVSIDVDYVAGVTSLWTLPAGRLCDDANLHRDYLGHGLGDVTVDTKLHNVYVCVSM